MPHSDKTQLAIGDPERVLSSGSPSKPRERKRGERKGENNDRKQNRDSELSI